MDYPTMELGALLAPDEVSDSGGERAGLEVTVEKSGAGEEGGTDTMALAIGAVVFIALLAIITVNRG